MRADGLPIGDNPVFMIGADRCVEGPFGDWDMVGVAWDWQWIDIFVQDWYWIGRWVNVCQCIGGLVMDCHWMVTLTLDWPNG